MVLATQNPIEYEGTYTLPESQLDRFMLRLEIGYPPPEDEIHIMRRRDPIQALERLQPALTAAEVIELQDAVGQVMVDDSVARTCFDHPWDPAERAHSTGREPARVAGAV